MNDVSFIAMRFASTTYIGCPAIIIWITLGIRSSAQEALLSARQALVQISEQPLPACQNALQLIQIKTDDSAFLYRKFQEAGWGNVASEYVLSLNDLADGLRDAGNEHPTDASCERIRLILSDLHTKRRDCEKLGHSRTEIPIEVSTNNRQD
jgi:hypothetical protein